MSRILQFVQNKLIFLILAVIIAGLFNVHFSGGWRFTPLICLLAALVMIYPSLVPLSFSGLKELKKHRWLLFLSAILNFIFVPLIAYLISGFLLADQPALRLGFIVLALLPGGGMVTTWALKSKADMPLTVGIIVLNLLLAIGLTPFGISYATKLLIKEKTSQVNQTIPDKNRVANKKIFSLPTENSITKQTPFVKQKSFSDNNNEECFIEKTTFGQASCGLQGSEITFLGLIAPVLFIVVFPLGLAWLTQRLIVKFKSQEYFQTVKKEFGQFSNLGLLIVLFVLMSLQNNATIFEQKYLLGKTFLALLFFYGLIFSVPYFIYKKFYPNAKGVALFWGSYLRYITLALGLGISLVFQNDQLSPLITVIVLSYFIQIPSSYYLSKIVKAKN